MKLATSKGALGGRSDGGKKSKKETGVSVKPHLSEKTRSAKKKMVTNKKEALQRALATALAAPQADAKSNAAADVDEYGKGSPTDRLQFGYAPSNAAEAVAFHSGISATKWIEDRRQNIRTAVVKKQKLARPNCEPMTSLLKLKQHWRDTAQFVAEVRGGDVGQSSADELLETFVSQQRVA